MKAIAVRLYDEKLRGRDLENEFGKLIPHWKSYFPRPISSNAVAQRADKARRYANEAPENNPAVKRYWRAAGEVVRRRTRLSKRKIDQIISMTT